jgi:hypothetical protein
MARIPTLKAPIARALIIAPPYRERGNGAIERAVPVPYLRHCAETQRRNAAQLAQLKKSVNQRTFRALLSVTRTVGTVSDGLSIHFVHRWAPIDSFSSIAPLRRNGGAIGDYQTFQQLTVNAPKRPSHRRNGKTRNPRGQK